LTEKLQIGTASYGKDSLIGSMFVCTIAVKKTFFRKFNMLKIVDADKLTDYEIKKTVAYTQKHVDHVQAFKIKPVDIDEANNIDDLEVRNMLETINTYPEFWKHRIIIKNPLESKEEFLEKTENLLPHNLKNIKNKLNVDKWDIDKEASNKNKACALASIYAKFARLQEESEIKEYWGDFGTGVRGDTNTEKFIESNDKCPHIRGKKNE